MRFPEKIVEKEHGDETVIFWEIIVWYIAGNRRLKTSGTVNETGNGIV